MWMMIWSFVALFLFCLNDYYIKKLEQVEKPVKLPDTTDIDAELWESLKDSDPMWLADMGIKAPVKTPTMADYANTYMNFEQARAKANVRKVDSQSHPHTNQPGETIGYAPMVNHFRGPKDHLEYLDSLRKHAAILDRLPDREPPTLTEWQDDAIAEVRDALKEN